MILENGISKTEKKIFKISFSVIKYGNLKYLPIFKDLRSLTNKMYKRSTCRV